MGLEFLNFDTDKNQIDIQYDYDKTDGKAFPYFALQFKDSKVYQRIRESDIWLYPLESIFSWQPPKRLLRPLKETHKLLTDTRKLNTELNYLKNELPALINALQQAIEEGVTEVRIGQPNNKPSSLIEKARSNRSKCKKCKVLIKKDELRLGIENLMYGSYEWYHLECGVEKGKDFIKAVNKYSNKIPKQQQLINKAKIYEKEDYPKFEYAPSNRSKCIYCRKKIYKDTVRVNSIEHVSPDNIKRNTFSHPKCATYVLEGYKGLSSEEVLSLITSQSKEICDTDLKKVLKEWRSTNS